MSKRKYRWLSNSAGFVFTALTCAIVAGIVYWQWSNLQVIQGSDHFDPEQPIQKGIRVDAEELESELNRLATEKRKEQAQKEKEIREAAEAKAKQEAEKKAKAEAAAQAKKEVDAKRKAEAADKAQKEAEQKEIAAKAKQQKELADKAKAEAAAQAKKEADAKRKAEAADKTQKEAEQKEIAARAKQEKELADQKAKAEAAAQAKKAAEAKAKSEAAAKAKRDKEAAEKAKADAETKAAAESARKANEARIANLLGQYLSQFSSYIQWTPNPQMRGHTTTVYFKLDTNGHVKGTPIVVKSSGNGLFDREVIAAILRSSPFPMPQEGEAIKRVVAEGIEIEFTPE